MIGNTLNNRYLVTARLGGGAMGEVYRATDTQTGQEVALKILARHLTFDSEMLERFRREGEALRQLSHPNIVRFVETFQHEGQQVIVLEYVGGGSLHQLIKQGPLPIDQACRIGLELCDALTRAHHLKIIHRDIKPENVLLTSDGTPKLTDFGVARLVSEGTRLTGTGTQVGTPFYMSPEAWQGQRLDGQTDIWSLGILLYEMVSGQVPFGGDTLVAVMNKVLTAPLPDLKPLRPDVPPELVKIVRKMLARDKAKRYQTIREVALDLERVSEAAVQTRVKASPQPRPPAPTPEPAAAETVLAPWLSKAETAPAPAPGEIETVLATPKPKPAGPVPSRGIAIAIVVAVVALLALVGIGGFGWWVLNNANSAGRATQTALVAELRATQTALAVAVAPTVMPPPTVTTAPLAQPTAPPVQPTTAPAQPTAAPAGGKMPIGIVLPTTDEPRWVQDQSRFTDALKAAGYDVQILFSQGDSAKEKANVEALISQGIKVLIICPQDGGAAAAAANEAHAAGVKVIAYDRAILNTASVDYYVTFDSIAVGKAQGQYLVDHAKGKGNPLYLYAGAASDNNAFVFFQGAWSVLQPKIADGTFVIKNSAAAVGLQGNATLTRDQEAQIIGQVTTNWDFAVAKRLAVSNLMAARAADKGNVFILAPNDGTARSIADAFAADKDIKSYVVTGQDAEKASVQYIIDGKQSMTVFKDVRTLVNDAIAAALAFLNGQTPPNTAPQPNGTVDVPAKPSVVVTVDKSNVKSALIDSGYYQASDFHGLAIAPVNLTIWDGYSPGGGEEAALNQLVARYQLTHPGVTIDVREQDSSQIFTKWDAQVAAGGATPDMFTAPNDYLGDEARKGAVAPIDDLIKGKLGNYLPAGVAGMTVDGKIYGVPGIIKAVGLYYNKANIPTPPKTTDDLMSLVKSGKKLTIINGDYFNYGWFPALGAKMFADDGTCTADQGGAADAMQYLLDLKNAGATFETDYGKATTAFEQGDTDMIVDGPWTLVDYKKALGAKLGATVMPAGPKGPSTPLSGVDGWYLNPNSKNKQAAVDLALYIFGPDGLKTYEDVAGDPAVIASLRSSDPLVTQFVAIGAAGYPRPQAQWFDNYWGPFTDLFTAVLESGTAPKDAVAVACAAMNKANGK